MDGSRRPPFTILGFAHEPDIHETLKRRLEDSVRYRFIPDSFAPCRQPARRRFFPARVYHLIPPLAF
jgi:hypothetical protein